MAGHSKWANIQHRKGRQDARRAKIWTRLIREIQIAARDAGPDPETNPRLRLALERAAAANMPKDNIERAIQRGAGLLDGQSLEEIRYEGYGVGGAAVIVDCMTDNRTRTVAEVRHAFSKYGGNLGIDGSVVFQFKHCGQFIFAPGTDEDQVMELAIEAGAEDVITDDEGLIEVVCAPADYEEVKNAFEAAGLTPEMQEVTMKPLNETELEGAEAETMKKMLEALESLDDVQEIYTSAVMDETE
ncbi:MAG TPA: YebC/PmpR family DNA-binding transcriptional regulator [Paenalcaligenes sp.]|nr:YebC/PmpR family DNA-binding transcriptional regulator [Paenalcaligenes sp.]